MALREKEPDDEDDHEGWRIRATVGALLIADGLRELEALRKAWTTSG